MISIFEGVLAALFVAVTTGAARWAWRISRTLDRLVDAVIPDGDRPSLRETVTANTTDIAVIKAQLTHR